MKLSITFWVGGVRCLGRSPKKRPVGFCQFSQGGARNRPLVISGTWLRKELLTELMKGNGDGGDDENW